jgi:hypothetical protein
MVEIISINESFNLISVGYYGDFLEKYGRLLLSFFYTYRSCFGVEADYSRCEEAFDMTTTNHLLGGENMHLRRGDKGYRVAQFESNIQLVRREEYAFVLLVRQFA